MLSVCCTRSFCNHFSMEITSKLTYALDIATNTYISRVNVHLPTYTHTTQSAKLFLAIVCIRLFAITRIPHTAHKRLSIGTGANNFILSLEKISHSHLTIYRLDTQLRWLCLPFLPFLTTWMGPLAMVAYSVQTMNNMIRLFLSVECRLFYRGCCRFERLIDTLSQSLCIL